MKEKHEKREQEKGGRLKKKRNKKERKGETEEIRKGR